MSTAVLIVNIVLTGFVFASVVGSLAWSIAKGRATVVQPLRTRQVRDDISAVQEDVGGQYAADQALVAG